jgi:twinkle protein
MNDQAEAIARHLLPAGRMQGREWEAGSINGESGKSLKVCLSGTKAGVWSDFAAGESGDLLDLWRVVRGHGSNREALAEIKAHLGIQEQQFERAHPKTYRKPVAPQGLRCPAGTSPVMEYLTKERKLTPQTIAAYQIGEVAELGPWENWSQQKPFLGPWIAFPYLRSGELLSVKYLHLKRKDGKKVTLVEPGCEPTCFGWHVIKPAAREVVICEGEIDAASLYQYGYPALSVPFGGGKGDKQQWVGPDWEYLEPFTTIYLCLDGDKEGAAATDELVNRLGLHRCRVVTLPKKDANECLKAGVSKAEIDKCFSDARYIEPDELKRANHFTAEVIEEFYPSGGKSPGFDMPWQKVPFRFLRGEVTVDTGLNGHGKSLLKGQVLLSATMQGERVCIASMEMHPRKTLYRLARQATGEKEPLRETIAECLDWMSDKIWLFDLVGTGKAERILEVFEYAYKRHGVKQFLIDSLMKCGIAEDDYKGQKAFIEKLCDFVQRTGTHIHLIAHMRKPADESSLGGKLDIKGTGAISDLAFNTFVVWRNKFKETTLKSHHAGEKVDLPKNTLISDVEKQPDALLICDKSRNIEGAEGRYALWYHAPSMQYLARPDAEPVRFFMTSAQQVEHFAKMQAEYLPFID